MNQKERKINRIKDSQIITKEIYLYYLRYFQKYGYSPHFREVAEALNINIETVRRHVKKLIDSELLATDHPGEQRTVRITGYKFTKTEEKKQCSS